MKSVFTYQQLEESDLRKILAMQGKERCKTWANATVFLLIPDCPQKAEKDCHVEAKKQNSKPTKPQKLNKLR